MKYILILLCAFLLYKYWRKKKERKLIASAAAAEEAKKKAEERTLKELAKKQQYEKERIRFVSQLGTECEGADFRQGLTPLQCDRTLIKGVTILDRGLVIEGKERCNDIVTILCRDKKFGSIDLSLYEEGVLVKFLDDYYFSAFSDSLIKKSYHKTTHTSFDYSDPIRFLERTLEKDYFYTYSRHSNLTNNGYFEDTRHYTKDGRLDKRYSKQNLHTGGWEYTYDGYTEYDTFYSTEHQPSIICNNINISLTNNVDASYRVFKILHSRADKAILKLDDMLSDNAPQGSIRFLTLQDKEEIRTLLTSNIDRQSMNAASKELIERIRQQRIMDLSEIK